MEIFLELHQFHVGNVIMVDEILLEDQGPTDIIGYITDETDIQQAEEGDINIAGDLEHPED